MERPSTQQLVVYAAVVAAIALIGTRYLPSQRAEPAPAERPVPVAVKRSSARTVVYVSGAVRRPGVYRLPAWARLDLALRRAGGPRSNADLDAVNLAAKVADGQQVVVPARVAPADAGRAGAPQGADAPISLNTATPEQLDELEGIGPTTAQKILDWRTQHGGFRSVEDLKQIGGIGPKRFETLKAKVRM